MGGWVLLGAGTYSLDAQTLSVAESLTWAWLWRYWRGRRCGDGWVQLGTVGYNWVQVHVYLTPIPLCRISDLGLAVEIHEGEAVRGRVGAVGYWYMFM